MTPHALCPKFLRPIIGRILYRLAGNPEVDVWALLQREEGWRPWRGGTCPLAEGVIFEAIFRNGVTIAAKITKSDEVKTPGKKSASELWLNTGAPLEIVAYRMTPPETPERAVLGVEL